MSYSLKTVLSEMAKLISPTPTPAHKREAEILLAHLLGIPRQDFLFKDDIEISQAIVDQAMDYAKRRSESEPVAKIIGKKEFWSLEFKVTKDTLDPRPDSETLIEAVLENCPDTSKAYKILDLGTGTGCLALALLSEYPSAQATAVDKSLAAIEVAQFNAKTLGAVDRIDFLHQDWNSALPDKYDIIVSNPPYITEDEFDGLAEDVKGFDPRSALVSGKTGLEDYKIIVKILDKSLADGGFFAIELGDGQVEDVRDMIKHHNLQALGVRKDIAGKARCLFGKKTLPI